MPPVARGVDGEGEQIGVFADGVSAEPQKPATLRQFVEVERDLLAGVGPFAPSAVDGVLLPVLDARVVSVTVRVVGHGRVVRLQSPDHLIEERLPEFLRRRRQRVGVGVFRLQVGEHLGARTVAEPGVGIDAAVAVKGLLLGRTPGGGRRGRGGQRPRLGRLFARWLKHGCVRGGRGLQRVSRETSRSPHVRTSSE
jgi:hypothetical protein